MRECFRIASQTRAPKFKQDKEAAGYGFAAVSSSTWRMTDYMILSLEKLGDNIDFD